MNIYLKAGLRTAFMLTTCFLAAAIVGFAVKYIPAEILGYMGLALLFGGLIYLAYSINLGQLRYEEKLQDLDKSIKNLTVDK